MTMLRTTVGLPGSGKTTDAIEWVAIDPMNRARINRDDLRAMMHGGYLGTREQEEQITDVRDAAVIKLLRRGISVIVDETNLRWAHLAHVQRMARRVQVDFEIVSYLDTSIEECVARDAARSHPVGENEIYSMWFNSLRNQITTWRSAIVRQLINWDYNTADRMVDSALGDPLSPKNSTVTDLAINLTKAKIEEFAPQATARRSMQ